MTEITLDLPGPLYDAITYICDIFRHDIDELIIAFLRREVESVANNDFEQLTDKVKAEVFGYLACLPAVDEGENNDCL